MLIIAKRKTIIMKNNIFLIFATLLLISSCNQTKTETSTNTSPQTKQTYIIHYPSDTTNYTDQYNRKQGMWINFNTANPKPILYKNDTAYPYTDSTLQDIIKMLNSKP